MKASTFLFFVFLILSILKSMDMLPPKSTDTGLKLTIIDLSTRTPCVDATVQLYGSLGDYQARNSPLITQMSDSAGEVFFKGLTSQRYYWRAWLGNKTNDNERNQAVIPFGTITSIVCALSTSH